VKASHQLQTWTRPAYLNICKDEAQKGGEGKTYRQGDQINVVHKLAHEAEHVPGGALKQTPTWIHMFVPPVVKHQWHYWLSTDKGTLHHSKSIAPFLL
jgi:hypothetical protein